ncbi:MAG: HEAT repeat domain-containing protein, partial [Planctomycetota bacterium]
MSRISVTALDPYQICRNALVVFLGMKATSFLASYGAILLSPAILCSVAFCVACFVPLSAIAQIEDQPVAELVEQLQSSDLKQRRDAVYELVRRGERSQDVIRGLAEVANDHDEQLQFQALMGLGRAGKAAQAAMPELLEAMQDRSDQPRYRASIALGNIGKPAVQPMLELWKKANTDTREDLARAFAMIGPDAKAALPMLQESLDSDREKLRRLAAEACIDIVLTTDSAAAFLLRLAENSSANVRIEAIRGLRGLEEKPQTALKQFEKSLQDQDDAVRELALQAAVESELPQDRLEAIILAGLLDASPGVRVAARFGQHKAQLDQTRLATALIGSLEKLPKSDADLSVSMIAMLSDMKLEESAEVRGILEQLLRLESKPEDIATELADFGPGALSTMIELLQEHPDFEPYVAAALSNAGDSASEVLLGGLKSELPVVRVTSIRAIGKIGSDSPVVSPELFQQIREMTRASEPAERAASLHTLALILSDMDEARIKELPTEKLDELLERASRDKSESVRAVACSSAASLPIRGTSQQRVLKAGLDDESPKVVTAALTSLENAPNLLSDLLQQVVRATQRGTIETRVAAFNSLGKITEDSDKKELIDALENGLTEESTRIRSAATNCLASLKIKESRLGNLLVGNLGRDEELLLASLEAISALKPVSKDLPRTLEGLLDHPQERVRVLAIDALATVQKDRSELVARLTGAVQDSSWNVRQKAVATLGTLGADAKSAVPAIFVRIANEEDESFASAAIREIDTAPVESIELLVKSLESEHLRTQLYAIY